MKFKVNSLFRSLVVFCCFTIAFSGCKVGDDDPAISFRSRDARVKANWKMMEMNTFVEINSLDPSGAPLRTEFQSHYDGYDVRVISRVNGVQVSDSTFGFNYQMKLEDNGKVTYENTIILGGIGTKSAGSDNWYWIDTDQKKARVFLGSALQFAATAGIGPLQSNATLPVSTLLTDFKVDGLRNKELKLAYQKSTGLTTLAGFQQVTITSNFTFNSK